MPYARCLLSFSLFPTAWVTLPGLCTTINKYGFYSVFVTLSAADSRTVQFSFVGYRTEARR